MKTIKEEDEQYSQFSLSDDEDQKSWLNLEEKLSFYERVLDKYQ